MASTKWFYPLQDKVKEYLKEKYSVYECQYQVITTKRVFESYMVRVGNDFQAIMVVMTRAGHDNYSIKIFDYNTSVSVL